MFARVCAVLCYVVVPRVVCVFCIVCCNASTYGTREPAEHRHAWENVWAHLVYWRYMYGIVYMYVDDKQYQRVMRFVSAIARKRFGMECATAQALAHAYLLCARNTSRLRFEWRFGVRGFYGRAPADRACTCGNCVFCLGAIVHKGKRRYIRYMQMVGGTRAYALSYKRLIMQIYCLTEM